MKKQQYREKASGREVTIVGPIVTDGDRFALREDEEFHEGSVALLRYPSVVGAVLDRIFKIPPGASIAKGEAGDFRILLDPDEEFEPIEVTA